MAASVHEIHRGFNDMYLSLRLEGYIKIPLSVGPRAEKFNIVSNDHFGQIWSKKKRKIKIVSLS